LQRAHGPFPATAFTRSALQDQACAPVRKSIRASIENSGTGRIHNRAGAAERSAAVAAVAVPTGSWAGAGQYFSAHVFEILLMVVFFALHRFDDNRREPRKLGEVYLL
jgi:hypothetical protein